MGNLFKLILFLFLLQGINAALTNMEPKNWDDVIFESQYGDDYCFSYVRPLLNYLKRVKKQIDAHDKMKEKNDKLEKELERTKIKLEEQETKLKYKEDLLNGKDEQINYLKNTINEKDGLISELLKTKNDLLNGKNEQIRDLKDLLNLKVEKIITQLNSQNEKTTGNSQDIKNFINSKAEQIRNQLKEQNAALTENNKQLKAKNQSEDKQINELKNAINAKNKQIQGSNDLLNLKVEKIITQLNSQNEKTTGNSQDIKNFINSKAEQIRNQLKEQNAALTENNKQLKAKNESEDKQINALKTAISEKNEQISDLRAQISKISKFLEEQDQQLMKYNQQEDNLPNMGLYVDNVHRIQVPGHPAFEVSYISSLTGWTVIQRRMDGSVDFDRDWEDYKKGFGDVRGEFFLGIEKLHLMTESKPHELYIQMRDVNGTTKYAHYDNFKVGSEKENFKLISVGKYSGTAGDSLEVHVGMMFTTRDRDNDLWQSNCANFEGGGWWFEKCLRSQLNGKYYPNGICPPTYGVIWKSWKNEDNKISLLLTQMMIRPKTLVN